MTATNDLDSGSDNDEENEDDSDDNTDDTSYEDVFKLTLALPKSIARKKTRSTPLLPHHLSGDTAILQMEKRIQDKVEAEAEKRRRKEEREEKRIQKQLERHLEADLLLLVLTKALLHYSIALGTLLIFLRHFEGGGAYGRSHVSLSLAIAKVFIYYLMMFQSLLAELQYRCSSYSSIIASTLL